MKHYHRQALLAGAVALGVVGTAWQPTLAADTETELEEVIITGTSIRGIEPVGSTPVLYGREQMAADAPANIGDVLANIPQIASFGTEQQLSTTNRFRTSGFIPVIHNMEIGSTLTLFNGHRMAPTGTEATFADPSIIPTIALERVEVVSDGNSAVYGSDAVAGVVNFLYRRDVNGFEVDLSTTQDPDTSYQNTVASALFGHTFSGGGQLMIAYEHAKHDPALNGEIPLLADADRRPLGGTDRRGTVCNEPNISFGSGMTATVYSGAGLATGAAARCNPDNDLPLGFESTRDSVLATGRFRPADGIEFWGELNWSKYEEPRNQNWTNLSVRVPSTSPYFWVPPSGVPAGSTCPTGAGFQVGANCQLVSIQAENIFGHRVQRATSKIWAITAGVSLDVGEAWKTDIRAHHSKTDDYWDALSLDTGNMDSLTTAGLFNPYANSVTTSTTLNRTPNSAAVLAQILNGSGTTNTGQQSLTELEVKADGPLFPIGGGEVRAAVGLNHRTEALRQVQDAGCQQAGCSFFLRQRDDDFARGVNSAFIELAAPIVSSANAKPGISELTLSLAGRFDKYDKLQGQTTPKVALNYKPIDSLSFHGSWGKSYAAPNIGLTTQTFSIVQLGMNINGVTYDTYNLGGGNSHLESERAKTYSFGVDWKPEVLAGFSAGATYYHVQYNNIIYKPGFPDLIDNPAFYSQRIVGDESQPKVPIDISQTIMNGIYAQYPPDRIIQVGQTFDLVARTYAINMYKRTFGGLDLNLRYDVDTGIGKLGFGVNANKQIERETQPVPGGPVSNDIGTFNAPVWQGRAQAQWGANAIPLRLTWVADYRGSYNLVNTNWLYGGGSDLRHNLTIAYDFENLFKGVTLQARVLNVFDKDPPGADTVQGYDDDNHNPYGRQFTVSVHARF